MKPSTSCSAALNSGSRFGAKTGTIQYLLVLHGGPGDATNPWGYAGFRSWLKTFTIVQWDQRGAGKTLGRNGPSLAPTITIERLTQDGVELAELLRRSLKKDKLLLLGHSWGSTLGVFMVKARPDLFYAFVGTGQVVDSARNYAVAYDQLLRKAKEVGDQRAVRELEEVGPPPYADGRGYAIQRRWSNLFEGADAFISSMFGQALVAPGYSLQDVNDWIEGQSMSGQRLIPQTSSLNPMKLAGEFAAPIVVIQGSEELHHADQPCQKLGRLHQGAAQGVHPHRRWPFRCVHEAASLLERTC